MHRRRPTRPAWYPTDPRAPIGRPEPVVLIVMIIYIYDNIHLCSITCAAVTEQKTDISPVGPGKPEPMPATLSVIPSQIISHNVNVLRLGFATRKSCGILRRC